MKIVMLTPAIKEASIGLSVSTISRALIVMGHDVVIVRSENEQFFSEPIHDFGTSTLICWNDQENIRHLMNTADLLVYQIGANESFYQGSLRWLEYFSGIVYLHDDGLTAWANARANVVIQADALKVLTLDASHAEKILALHALTHRSRPILNACQYFRKMLQAWGGSEPLGVQLFNAAVWNVMNEERV